MKNGLPMTMPSTKYSGLIRINHPCCKELQRMKEKLHEQRRNVVNCKNSILLHDIALPHSAEVYQVKIIGFEWSVVPYPSSDLAHLSGSLQNFLNIFFNIPEQVRSSKISSIPRQPHFTRKEFITLES